MKNNKFNLIKNIADDKSEATIIMYKPIGNILDDDTGEIIYGISDEEFANTLNYLAQCGVNKINLRINSIGGSVMTGFGIISAMKAFDGDIYTYNDGLCA